jgi:dolichyl-phosphate-mannose--protein O-mannosyl transferase
MYLYSVLFQNIPMPENDFIVLDFAGYFREMSNLMLLSLPFTAIAYGMMLSGGIKLLKKEETGIHHTRISAWVIIAWYVLYLAYFSTVMKQYFDAMFGSGFTLAMLIAGGLFGMVMVCGYPVFLLIYFNKPRKF